MSYELFKEQINFLNFKNYDCLVVSYQMEYYNTGQYLDKKVIGYNLTNDNLLSKYDELKDLNCNNYNIYIRDADFMNSRLFIIDDILEKNNEYLINKVNLINRKKFSKPYFYIKTSTKDFKNNYQVGFLLNDNVPILLKDMVLKEYCELFEADMKHANINKYFRISGFKNNKIKNLETYCYLDKLEQSNDIIKLEKYENKIN